MLGLVKRHPVFVFYLLAFAFSWLGWVPQSLYARGLFPFDSPLFALLGGVGPTLAAIVVLGWSGEKDGLRNLFGALFKMRFAWGWYLLVFGFWFAVAGIALGIGALFGQAFPAVVQFAWGSLPSVLIGMLLSNVWEEIGWRGFALPRLRRKYPDLTVVLLMGLLWSLWHLPLMLNPSSPMAALPWYGEILFSLSLTAIYTWLYLHTGESLFGVTLFHAMSNTIAFLLFDAGVFSTSYPFVVGVTTLFAVAVVLIYGPQRFKTTLTQVSL